MQTNCPNCDREFNIPDEKIPESGARIRCKTCDTVFKVQRQEEELESNAFQDFSRDESLLEPQGNTDDLFGSAEDLDSTPRANEDLTPTKALVDAGNGPRVAFEKKTPEAASNKPAVPYPDFDWDDPEQIDVASVGEKQEEDIIENDLLSSSLFEPGLKATHASDVLHDHIPGLPDTSEVDTARMRRVVSFAVLMLLIAGSGGWVALNMDRVLSIPWGQAVDAVAEAVGLKEPPAPPPVVNIGSKVLEVYEQDTLFEYELLVVEGIVRNLSEETQTYLKVDVTLYSKEGTAIAETSVFAGNKLPGIQLKTLGLEKIQQRHDRDFGENLANSRVASGAILPFQAVFSPVPDNYYRAVVKAYPTKGKKNADIP